MLREKWCYHHRELESRQSLSWLRVEYSTMNQYLRVFFRESIFYNYERSRSFVQQDSMFSQHHIERWELIDETLDWCSLWHKYSRRRVEQKRTINDWMYFVVSKMRQQNMQKRRNAESKRRSSTLMKWWTSWKRSLNQWISTNVDLKLELRSSF